MDIVLETTALGQAYILGTTLALGLAAGIIFDFYRVLRGFWRLPPGITFVADLLFWFVCTILVIIALIQVSWGEVRIYVFFGLGLGVLFYYYLCSKRVIRFWVVIFSGIRRCFLFIQSGIIKFRAGGFILFNKFKSFGKNFFRKR